MISFLRSLSFVLLDYERSKDIHDTYVIYESIKFILLLVSFFFLIFIGLIVIYNVFNNVLNALLGIGDVFNNRREIKEE